MLEQCNFFVRTNFETTNILKYKYYICFFADSRLEKINTNLLPLSDFYFFKKEEFNDISDIVLKFSSHRGQH